MWNIHSHIDGVDYRMGWCALLAALVVEFQSLLYTPSC